MRVRAIYEVSSLRLLSSRVTVALTSTHNPRLQEIRKAAKAGRRTPDDLIVAEGPHLLEEVLGSAWRVEQIYGTAEALGRHAGLLRQASAPVTEVSARGFASMAGTETSQGLLALVRPRCWTWDDVVAGRALVVVLDAVQDPGNVGTIIRSAEAFGASGIVLTEGCARVSSGKVLRAAAGSLFRLPFVEAVGRATVLKQLTALRLYALDAAGRTSLIDVDLSVPCALLVGNEGAGVAGELLSRVESISIPTSRVESLNAAIACSLVLWEAARQRKGL